MGAGGTTHKFVNNWSYVIPDGTKISHTAGNEFDYTTTLVLPLKDYTTKEELANAINTALPKKIFCQGGNAGGVLVAAGFEPKDTAPGTGTIEGYVPVKWDLTKVSFPVTSGTILQLYADPVSNPTYLLRVNTKDSNYKDSNGGEADTAETNDILNLTVTVRTFDISNHIVPAANPQNVTVNLFDYWVKTEEPTTATNGDILDKSDKHYHEDGGGKDGNPVVESATSTGYSTQSDWNRGINQGHLLLFGDGLIHAGLWNKGAGENCRYGREYAGMEGIVKNVLDSSGYPEMNLETANKVLADNGARDETLIKDYALTGDHIEQTKAPGDGGYTYNSSNIQNLSNTVLKEALI